MPWKDQNCPAAKEYRRKKAKRQYWKHRDERLISKKKYYEDHKEECSARMKEWREKNAVTLKAKKREYTLSHPEQNIDRIIAWKDADADRLRKSGRDYIRRLKLDVIKGYGGACVCCGETSWEFLTIDHIKGGGYAHRKIETGRNLYIRLRREHFPRGEYQLLCWNCNAAKGIFGCCPHESSRLQGLMREELNEGVG